MSEPQTILGKDLRVGDVIETWWAPYRNRIDHLTPYVGPLAKTVLPGTRIASFAVGNLGMTIEAGAQFQVFSRA